MAESVINGYWKGVIVTQTNVTRLDVYFDDEDGELKARFEAPDATNMPTKGELKVLLDGGKLTMVSSGHGETVWFTGDVRGEATRPHMIHGVINDPKFTLVAVSLTLFAQHRDLGDLPLMYRST